MTLGRLTRTMCYGAGRAEHRHSTMQALILLLMTSGVAFDDPDIGRAP
jgi:hypothetical protein